MCYYHQQINSSPEMARQTGPKRIALKNSEKSIVLLYSSNLKTLLSSCVPLLIQVVVFLVYCLGGLRKGTQSHPALEHEMLEGQVGLTADVSIFL